MPHKKREAIDAQQKALHVIYPDDEPKIETDYIRYKYSDSLFAWFYNKLKYFSHSISKWKPCIIDERWTRKDNKENGCRIFLEDGNYIKFYEVYFLMEFTNKEWEEIDNQPNTSIDIKMSDVINYYYSLKK